MKKIPLEDFGFFRSIIVFLTSELYNLQVVFERSNVKI